MQHIHEYPPVEVSTNVEDATGVGLLLESNEEEDSFHTCSQRSGSDNASERDVQPARAVNRTKRLRTWSGMLGSLFKRTHEDDYQPVHG
jgi:hypothetical protein